MSGPSRWEPHDEGYLNNLAWQKEVDQAIKTYVPVHIRLDVTNGFGADEEGSEGSEANDPQLNVDYGFEAAALDDIDAGYDVEGDSDYGSDEGDDDYESEDDVSAGYEGDSEARHRVKEESKEGSGDPIKDIASIDAEELNEDENFSTLDFVAQVAGIIPEVEEGLEVEASDAANPVNDPKYYVQLAPNHPMPVDLLHVLEGLVKTEKQVSEGLVKYLDGIADIVFDGNPPVTWLKAYNRNVARTLAHELVEQ
jgi:hypothetical protein